MFKCISTVPDVCHCDSDLEDWSKMDVLLKLVITHFQSLLNTFLTYSYLNFI